MTGPKSGEELEAQEKFKERGRDNINKVFMDEICKKFENFSSFCHLRNKEVTISFHRLKQE